MDLNDPDLRIGGCSFSKEKEQILIHACNRLGHRSSRCGAVTDVKPPPIDDLTVQPPPTDDLTVKPHPTDDLTTKPQLLIPSNSGPGSAKKSKPVYYEVSVIDSIKRLETELAEIKQELALMKAMAGIKLGTSDFDREKYTTSRTIVTSHGAFVITKSAKTNTPQNQGICVPVAPLNQGSWISQIARTKIKKAKSDSIELNKVILSREKRSVQFKRVATKNTEREEMRGTTGITIVG